MRLLRLLTAGRSLVGLKDSAGRYHVTDQRLLPKFGSEAGKPANGRWFGQCASKLASLLAPAPKPVKPEVPRLAKSPVQAELSLDAIKVVRNDLSDSDLEVIPALAPAPAPAPQASPAPAPVPVESAEPVGATWSRVSTRLFGANKTLT